MSGLLLPDGTPAESTTLAEPRTWGQAAQEQYDLVLRHTQRVWGNEDDHLMPDYVSANIEERIEKMLSGQVSTAAIAMHLFDIGAVALTRLDPELWPVIVPLLCGKQHDYGHNNILRTGLLGILVRLSDKSARYAHLLGQMAAARNEPLTDTVIDIVGYCVIGLMLMDGTFELPL